jgi:broad specificity phosphatase PhoE
MAGEQSGKDGTKASGFVHSSENRAPRQCGNCIFFCESGKCNNRSVIEDPEVPKNADGTAKVDADDCSDHFMSRGNAIIYALRHGETANNKQKKFRGWIDVPLNETGKSEAKEAREFLADKGIKRVFASDLGRAGETAKLALPSIKAEKDPLMRPWDVGVFSGKDREDTQDDFNHYIDNPDVRIPDGESLKEFATRMNKVFKRYVKEGQEDGPILLVWHSSNCIQLEKQVEGEDELGRPEDVDRVLPGGVMAVLDEGDGKFKVEIVFGDSPEQQADYGS